MQCSHDCDAITLDKTILKSIRMKREKKLFNSDQNMYKIMIQVVTSHYWPLSIGLFLRIEVGSLKSEGMADMFTTINNYLFYYMVIITAYTTQ